MSDNMGNLDLNETVSLVLNIKGRIPTDARFKVLATRAGYEIAKSFDDVDGIHAANLAYLPEGTPKSASLLNYTILESLADGKKSAVADDWVAQVTKHDVEDYDLKLSSISTSEYSDLIKVLNNYGFKGRYELTRRGNG